MHAVLVANLDQVPHLIGSRDHVVHDLRGGVIGDGADAGGDTAFAELLVAGQLLTDALKKGLRIRKAKFCA